MRNSGGLSSISIGASKARVSSSRLQTGIKQLGLLNQDVGEIGEDAPVPGFIGVGERAASGGLAEAGVIEFGAEGKQAGFDVAEAFAPGKLGGGQDEEVFVGGQFAAAEVAVITGDTGVEIVFGQEVQKLGEDGATLVHGVENRKIRETTFKEPL